MRLPRPQPVRTRQSPFPHHGPEPRKKSLRPVALKRKKWATAKGATLTKKRWWVIPDRCIFIPTTGGHLVKLTHLEKTTLGGPPPEALHICQLPALGPATREQGTTCAKCPARPAPRPPPGVQRMGVTPFKNLERNSQTSSQAGGSDGS